MKNNTNPFFDNDIWYGDLPEDLPIEPSDSYVSEGRVINEQEHLSLLDKIRSHKRVVTAILLFSGIAATAVTGLKSIGDGERHDAERAVAGVEYVPATPSTEMRDTTPSESPFAQFLFNAENLPELLESPFVLANEQVINGKTSRVSEMEAGGSMPNARFEAAYESITGIKFNIYTINRTGQSTGEFEINPESIEFLLATVGTLLEGAPESVNRDSMIQTLEAIKSGEIERVIDLAIDVTPGQDCLDANRQLVEAAEEICTAWGLTGKSTSQAIFGFSMNEVPGEDRIEVPIVVAIDSGAETEVYNTGFDEQRGIGFRVRTYDIPQPNSAMAASQLQVAGHEILHAVDDSIYDMQYDRSFENTYQEGDGAHETTAYIFGDNSKTRFDMEGSVGASPNLYQEILNLVEEGVLPPIIQHKGAGSSAFTDDFHESDN